MLDNTWLNSLAQHAIATFDPSLDDARFAATRTRPTPNGLIGRRLAELRRAAGLSRAHLGAAAQIPQDLLTAYERGDRRIPATDLLSLVDTLGIGVAAILGAVLTS